MDEGLILFNEVVIYLMFAKNKSNVCPVKNNLWCERDVKAVNISERVAKRSCGERPLSPYLGRVCPPKFKSTQISRRLTKMWDK